MGEKICGCDDFAGGFICKAVGSRYIKEGAGLSGTVHGPGRALRTAFSVLHAEGSFEKR